MRRSLPATRLQHAIDRAQPGIRVLLFAALTAAVVPFLLLTQYAHPSGDDFCYASAFGRGDFWSNVKGEYLGWKGRYSAIVLTAAYHAMGGMLLTYNYVLLLYFVALAAAIYAFMLVVTECTGSRWRGLALALGFCALYLGTMPMVPATLYWLDGAFQYQTGSIFVLLALATLLMLHRTGTSRWAALACIFIFIAIGATETAMITLLAVVGPLAIDRLWLRPGARPDWVAVIIVTVAASLLLTLAPGNFARAQFAAPEAGRFWFSFSHAWFHAGQALADWLANPALWLATAAFVPGALRMVYLDGVRQHASWIRLGLIVALILALIWSCFFALWWAAATNPPGRMLNMVYLVFLIGWFAAVLELLAKAAAGGKLVLIEETFPAPWRLLSNTAMALFAAVILLQSQARTAWEDLLYRAPGYDHAMHDRYARIAQAKQQPGSEAPAMVFQYIAQAPQILVYTDIQNDPGNWRNTCFARYFGLRSVRRQ